MNTYTFKLTKTGETVVIKADNFSEAMVKLRARA